MATALSLQGFVAMISLLSEAALIQAIASDPDLVRLECVPSMGTTGGVAISRHGHHLGLWHVVGRRLSFTPGGNRTAAVIVESIADALKLCVQHTQFHAAKRQ